MVWLPDGSALTVMDSQGTAALLDPQGKPHNWHLAAPAGSGTSQAVVSYSVLPYKLWGAKAARQRLR